MKKMSLLSFLAFSLLGSLHSMMDTHSPKISPEEELEIAQTFMERAPLPKRKFTSTIPEILDSSTFLKVRGIDKIKANELGEAERIFTQMHTQTTSPTDRDFAAVGLARVNLDQGKLDEAQKHIKKAVQSQDESIRNAAKEIHAEVLLKQDIARGMFDNNEQGNKGPAFKRIRRSPSGEGQESSNED